MHTRLRRIAAATTALTAAVLIGALPAAAHVTVNSANATQGGYAKLTFRVPTEKDSATVKLEIAFPEDAPLAGARVKPQPGWDYEVKMVRPASPVTDSHGNTVDSVVGSIVWTATGDGVKPGEFDEFDISVGPLPTADTMTFKALQTYADGEVVRWIEVPASEGDEPDHPAPVLTLAAPGEDGHAQPSPAAQPAGADAGDGDDDQAAGTSPVAWVALVLSVISLGGLGAVAVTSRRGRTTA